MRVLYIAQEISPYLPESEIALKCRHLPQAIQEKGKEIRTFMPRYGSINERRNQLHEVIRLSGMNLVIDDTDHPLIIKVASIQSARMQVYFIDNEDFFHRKAVHHDDNGIFFSDNDERAIFFARGVIETVKKLRWSPDVIHCHGWISSIVPLLIKYVLKENPLFENSKIVISIYNDEFNSNLDKSFHKKLLNENIPHEKIDHLKQEANYVSLMKTAIDASDAVIAGVTDLNTHLIEYIKLINKTFLEYQNEDCYVDSYNDLYDSLFK